LRFRDFRLEDWLLVVLGLAVIVFFTWILSACSTQQQAAEATYSDGCYFHIAGIDSTTAEQMHERWDFEGCKVKSDSDDSTDLTKE
jgi:hypothetical protein